MQQWQLSTEHDFKQALPGQRKRPRDFPTIDAIVSPIPKASIPEYNASLQPARKKKDFPVCRCKLADKL